MIAFVTMVNPVAIVAGIAGGLVPRRWSHVGLSAVFAPLAYWLYSTLSSRPVHVETLVPMFAVAGLLWGTAMFALKRDYRVGA
jgi:hypothetical protein